ncbi:MAG: HU family DNA-binding protein, partial [Nitrospirota bacterium]
WAAGTRGLRPRPRGPALGFAQDGSPRRAYTNQGQLAEAVADRFRLSEAEARQLLAFTLQEIAAALKAGRRVYLRGFGSFTKVIRPGRKVRHPRTGEIIWIPPRPDVDFRASPAVLRGRARARRR